MNLLLVRLSAIGDVVHALPALEVLRRALPDAEIGWVVEPPAAPLLEGHPALDQVVVLDRRGALAWRGRSRGLRRLAAGVQELRRTRWDAALDLQGLLRSAGVARLSGARRVLGPAWAREGARYLYTDRLTAPRPGEAHAVERALWLARAAAARLAPGAPVDGGAPAARLGGPLPCPPPGLAATGEEGPLLVLLPGAGKPANRPPPGLLVAVADRCALARPGARVALVGGAADAAAGAAVVRRARVARPVSWCGRLELPASAALLAAADVVVGGDTGPLHLARALGRPVVALFHAADPARTGPAGLPGAEQVRVLRGAAACAPCLARRCRRLDRRRVCLAPLTPERVAGEVLELLDRGRA